jgi:hypothetical protein
VTDSFHDNKIWFTFIGLYNNNKPLMIIEIDEVLGLGLVWFSKPNFVVGFFR